MPKKKAKRGGLLSLLAAPPEVVRELYRQVVPRVQLAGELGRAAVADVGTQPNERGRFFNETTPALRRPVAYEREKLDEYIAPGTRQEHLMKLVALFNSAQRAKRVGSELREARRQGKQARFGPGLTPTVKGAPLKNEGAGAEADEGVVFVAPKGSYPPTLARHETQHTRQQLQNLWNLPVLRDLYQQQVAAYYASGGQQEPWAKRAEEIDAEHDPIGPPINRGGRGWRRDAIGQTMLQNVGRPAGESEEWWPETVNAWPEFGGTRAISRRRKRKK